MKPIEELANVIAHICPDLVESSCGECDCVSCLATKLHKEGVTIQKWIPVTERLPDLELSNAKANDMDFLPCLCVIPNKRARNGKYVTKLWYAEEGFVDDDDVHWDEVTHWMPLPEPPKGE